MVDNNTNRGFGGVGEVDEVGLALPDPEKRLVGIRKFNKANRAIILGALKRGNYMGDAAALAGVHPSTLRTWITKGREDYDNEVDSDWAEFYTDVLRAEASSTDAALGRIQQAAEKGFWKADAWRLERKHPDKWGKQSQVVVHGDSPTKNMWAHISDPNEQLNVIKALNGDAGPTDEDLILDAEFTQIDTARNSAQDPGPADAC